MKDEKKKHERDRPKRGLRFSFGGRPAALSLLLVLLLLVIAAYRITTGLGVHDRASFIREMWGVLGIVFLFLLGGAALGFLLVLAKSYLRRRRGTAPWQRENDEDSA